MWSYNFPYRNISNYGHYQASKHVVVPYVENTLYPINMYSCVRTEHTLYISSFTEHNWDIEPHDRKLSCVQHTLERYLYFENVTVTVTASYCN